MNFFLKWLLIFSFVISVEADFLPKFTKNMENSKQERLKYAKEYKKRITDIIDSMPSISPQSKRWIEAELVKYEKTRNWEIYNNLEKSIDFKVFKVKKYFKTYNKYLDDIIYSSSIKREMYYWAYLMDYLSLSNIWLDIHDLYKKKYIKRTLIMPKEPVFKGRDWGRDEIYDNNNEVVSRFILQNIMIPYLAK